MILEVQDLGLMEYEQAWKLQDEYAGEVAEGRRAATLLLVEHPHVYTFGRRGKASSRRSASRATNRRICCGASRSSSKKVLPSTGWIVAAT